MYRRVSQNATWFDRDDLDLSALQGFLGAGNEYAVYASWFYYSGYPDITRWNFNDDDQTSDPYYMDAAYATCILVSYITFFIAIVNQMLANLSLQKVDPEV